MLSTERIYKVKEVFYSIKGEGLWTGTPMTFIRLAGCNLTCDFCDTNYETEYEASAMELVDTVDILSHGSKRVVLTGGEPLMQYLDPLLNLLRTQGYLIHLETNGTIPIPTNKFDWVAMCPKSTHVSASNCLIADEIKVLCGQKDWADIADVVAIKAMSRCKLMIMPLTMNYEGGGAPIDNNIQMALKYCREHPRFSFCCQIHKIFGFK